jgi:hypothetical protein
MEKVFSQKPNFIISTLYIAGKSTPHTTDKVLEFYKPSIFTLISVILETEELREQVLLFYPMAPKYMEIGKKIK